MRSVRWSKEMSSWVALFTRDESEDSPMILAFSILVVPISSDLALWLLVAASACAVSLMLTACLSVAVMIAWVVGILSVEATCGLLVALVLGGAGRTRKILECRVVETSKLVLPTPGSQTVVPAKLPAEPWHVSVLDAPVPPVPEAAMLLEPIALPVPEVLPPARALPLEPRVTVSVVTAPEAAAVACAPFLGSGADSPALAATRRLLKMYEAARVLLCETDINGNVTEWNAFSAATTGHSRHEVLGRPVWSFLQTAESYRRTNSARSDMCRGVDSATTDEEAQAAPAGDSTGKVTPLLQALADAKAGKSTVKFVTKFQTKMGRWVHVQASTSVTFAPDGTGERILILGNDVTDATRIRERLLETERIAERLISIVPVPLAVVTHPGLELRTANQEFENIIKKSSVMRSNSCDSIAVHDGSSGRSNTAGPAPPGRANAASTVSLPPAGDHGEFHGTRLSTIAEENEPSDTADSAQATPEKGEPVGDPASPPSTEVDNDVKPLSLEARVTPVVKSRLRKTRRKRRKSEPDARHVTDAALAVAARSVIDVARRTAGAGARARLDLLDSARVVSRVAQRPRSSSHSQVHHSLSPRGAQLDSPHRSPRSPPVDDTRHSHGCLVGSPTLRHRSPTLDLFYGRLSGGSTQSMVAGLPLPTSNTTSILRLPTSNCGSSEHPSSERASPVPGNPGLSPHLYQEPSFKEAVLGIPAHVSDLITPLSPLPIADMTDVLQLKESRLSARARRASVEAGELAAAAKRAQMPHHPYDLPPLRHHSSPALSSSAINAAVARMGQLQARERHETDGVESPRLTETMPAAPLVVESPDQGLSSPLGSPALHNRTRNLPLVPEDQMVQHPAIPLSTTPPVRRFSGPAESLFVNADRDRPRHMSLPGTNGAVPTSPLSGGAGRLSRTVAPSSRTFRLANLLPKVSSPAAKTSLSSTLMERLPSVDSVIMRERRTVSMDGVKRPGRRRRGSDMSTLQSTGDFSTDLDSSSAHLKPQLRTQRSGRSSSGAESDGRSKRHRSNSAPPKPVIMGASSSLAGKEPKRTLYSFFEELATNVELPGDESLGKLRALEDQPEEKIVLQLTAGMRIVEVTAVPLMGESSATHEGTRLPALTLITLRELTEEISAVTSALMIKKAEGASEAKTEFVARLSHELRNPLVALVSGLELLERDSETADSEEKDLLVMMRKASRLLMTIINDILYFSKVERNHEKNMDTENFDVRGIVETSMDMMACMGRKKGLRMCAYVDPHIWTKVSGTPIRITQLLINLLSNAIKFTHTGYVVIDVGLVKELDDAVVINFSCRDSGIGIDRDHVMHLGTPFFQVERAREGQGTGLGLAISSHIIRHMGSLLHCSSSPGKGSRFHFDLVLPKADCDCVNMIRRPHATATVTPPSWLQPTDDISIPLGVRSSWAPDSSGGVSAGGTSGGLGDVTHSPISVAAVPEAARSVVSAAAAVAVAAAAGASDNVAATIPLQEWLAAPLPTEMHLADSSFDTSDALPPVARLAAGSASHMTGSRRLDEEDKMPLASFTSVESISGIGTGGGMDKATRYMQRYLGTSAISVESAGCATTNTSFSSTQQDEETNLCVDEHVAVAMHVLRGRHVAVMDSCAPTREIMRLYLECAKAVAYPCDGMEALKAALARSDSWSTPGDSQRDSGPPVFLAVIDAHTPNAAKTLALLEQRAMSGWRVGIALTSHTQATLPSARPNVAHFEVLQLPFKMRTFYEALGRCAAIALPSGPTTTTTTTTTTQQPSCDATQRSRGDACCGSVATTAACCPSRSTTPTAAADGLLAVPPTRRVATHGLGVSVGGPEATSGGRGGMTPPTPPTSERGKAADDGTAGKGASAGAAEECPWKAAQRAAAAAAAQADCAAACTAALPTAPPLIIPSSIAPPDAPVVRRPSMERPAVAAVALAAAEKAGAAATELVSTTTATSAVGTPGAAAEVVDASPEAVWSPRFSMVPIYNVKNPPQLATLQLYRRTREQAPREPLFLVVDDMWTNLVCVGKVLAKIAENIGASISVCYAADGDEAVAMYDTYRVSFIFLDVNMNRMHGHEACKAIRILEHEYEWPRVPIAALTGQADEPTMLSCYAVGMDEYLTKPFTKEILLGAIQRFAPSLLASQDVEKIA